MTSPFASGKNAKGQCDMCAGVYMLNELRKETVDLKPTGFLVCVDCLDQESPQLQLGRFPIDDPQGVRDPRLDRVLADSRALWGFSPVGNQATTMHGVAGSVVVTV